MPGGSPLSRFLLPHLRPKNQKGRFSPPPLKGGERGRGGRTKKAKIKRQKSKIMWQNPQVNCGKIHGFSYAENSAGGRTYTLLRNGALCLIFVCPNVGPQVGPLCVHWLWQGSKGRQPFCRWGWTYTWTYALCVHPPSGLCSSSGFCQGQGVRLCRNLFSEKGRV